MLKILPLLILTTFALTACGPGDSPSANESGDPGIIGGKAVKSGDPLTLSVVALRDQSSKENICTGTLLTSQIVLTAGHCVEDYLNFHTAELEIVLGNSSWNRDSANFFVAQKIITHPVYADKERKERDAKIIAGCQDKNCGMAIYAGLDQGDIALILLQSAIPAQRVRPVALNEKVKSYINGSKTLVVGFGMHSLDNDDDTGFLRSFETEIYRTYKDVDVSSFKKVAIPSNYDDGACVGDSGGPAFVQRGGQLVQVGIGQGSLEIDTKKKFACNQKSLGYTDIASYLPWILQTRIELEATLEANLVTPGINTK